VINVFAGAGGLPTGGSGSSPNGFVGAGYRAG
jgi:hypothetical protein